MTSTVIRLLCCIVFAVALVSCGDQGDSTSEDKGSAIPASEAANGPKPDKAPTPTQSEPAAEGFKVLPFDDAEMPELYYKGQLQGGAHWEDLYGEHYLLLSSTSYNGEEGSTNMFCAEIYNTGHGDKTWSNMGSHYVNLEETEVAFILEDRYIRPTDLNDDGYGEVAYLVREEHADEEAPIYVSSYLYTIKKNGLTNLIQLNGEVPAELSEDYVLLVKNEGNDAFKKADKIYQDQLTGLFDEFSNWWQKFLEDLE